MDGDQETVPTAEDLSQRLTVVAHHEAGHIVIASALCLPLRPEGISLDPQGHGLACYCKHPDGTDVSRERVILSTFAGCFAQDRFSQENALPTLDYLARIGGLDWWEARGTLVTFSGTYFAGRGSDAVLEERYLAQTRA
jgi:hypothetical protein